MLAEAKRTIIFIFSVLQTNAYNLHPSVLQVPMPKSLPILYDNPLRFQ